MSAGRPLPDPRAWLAGAPFPWPAAATLGAGDAITACYAVVAVQLLHTRQGKPYLKVQLTDCHGAVEARVWDGAERFADVLHAGSYVGVRGRVEIFNNERQLKVESIEPVRVEFEDLRYFLPQSRRSSEAMEAELQALLDSIADPPLRQLLDTLLGAGTDTGRAFRLAPAAKYNHHACLGGLWEHSLSVATVCAFLAAHYGATVDRDLVVAAALIHDIGKIREIGAQPGFPYTDEGKLLGHILIGLQIVSDAARSVPALPTSRRLLLEHLVASHQGRYEWQSPREPRILEGLILHYADDLDAKMQQVANLLGGTPGWSAYDRGMQRDFLRHLRDSAADAADARPNAQPNAADVAPRAAPGHAPEAAESAAHEEPDPGRAGRRNGDEPPSYADEPEPTVPVDAELREIAEAAAAFLEPTPRGGEHEPGRRVPRLSDDSLDLFGD